MFLLQINKSKVRFEELMGQVEANKWKTVCTWFEEDNLKFYSDYVPISGTGKPTVNRLCTSLAYSGKRKTRDQPKLSLDL